MDGTFSRKGFKGFVTSKDALEKWAYFGPCQLILRNGKNVYEFHGEKGRLTYNDGAVYTGSFAHGKRHGRGDMTDRKRDRYVGRFVEDRILDEDGAIFFANGNVYTGSVEDFEMHGVGKLKYIRNGGYHGNFVHGEFLGRGILTLKNVDRTCVGTFGRDGQNRRSFKGTITYGSPFMEKVRIGGREVVLEVIGFEGTCIVALDNAKGGLLKKHGPAVLTFTDCKFGAETPFGPFANGACAHVEFENGQLVRIGQADVKVIKQ